MQAFFIVFGLLLLSTELSASGQDYCTSTECQIERRRNSLMLQEYQKELLTYKEALQESSCSICNIDGQNPCENNGTCVVTGPYTFICDCPDNTAGANCSQLLTCEAGDCGTNATCTVFNHKKVCTCPPGYAGDPTVACNMRTKTACMSGDPHYTTFDGTTFDYMGSCPYYVMKSCNSDDFSIVATNIIASYNPLVSYLKEFTLTTQGHEFKVDYNLLFYMDDINYNIPYYWPSITAPKIIVTKPSNKIYIQDNESGAILTYYQSFLCAEVPLTPFFYGNNTMCGLWGSINDICLDDIQSKNGTLYPEPSTCIVPRPTAVAALHLMDTWVSDSVVDNCVEGELINNMTNCNIPTAQSQCSLIGQAMNGTGPFAACNAIGHDILDSLYHDCTFDICSGTAMCQALEDFAHRCLDALPLADIDEWRTISNCPYLQCPPHSHYSMRTPKCQNSCSNHNYTYSSNCRDGFEEGCKCDPNYYFDSNGDDHAGFPFICRLLGDCGCLDANGNYHKPNEHTLSDNCTVATQCTDGVLTTSHNACSADGQCINLNGDLTCQCLPGYTGDGYTCTDIDECLDPHMCSADVGQGICTNLPGTYNCTCYSPYSGSNCESYLPSRHCADLYVFHGIAQNGSYSVSIGADYTSQLTDADLIWTEVFCDMESNGGGWTLMSHGNGSAGKTFNEYVSGFGDPSSVNVWLGLENIYAMTATTPTSLRIIIEQCAIDTYPDEMGECIYPYFTISDSSSQYAVFINSTSTCEGPPGFFGRGDGWISWPLSQAGPIFSTFDKDNDYNCSKAYLNTGWWFNKNGNNLCGYANLNGLRYVCGDEVEDNIYLTWNKNSVEDAFMYLRPVGYPNYDNHHAAAGTAEPTVFYE